jgi:hypothetical protein
LALAEPNLNNPEHHIVPTVGVSLLAMAAWQPTSSVNVRSQSRASSLPQDLRQADGCGKMPALNKTTGLTALNVRKRHHRHSTGA